MEKQDGFRQRSAPKPYPWKASRQTLVFRDALETASAARDRPAAPSLRSESADGRKMERVITKRDPDSADVDLSQREHLNPIEWVAIQ